MLNMQAFHKWLSSTAKAQNAYQRHLRQLVQASRIQVMNAQSDLTWAIWSTN
ncbi:MAG: hypothetical protein GXP40_01840 [Chloroflexi bacterium]|nr:hypothetical protein [Chloroflexota bacterium]